MSIPSLKKQLKLYASEIGPVLPVNLSSPDVCRLDFTSENPYLKEVDLQETAAFNELVQELLKKQNASIGIGGYLENRIIYRRSTLFDEVADKRTVHLGIDIWMEAGTLVFAPLDGRVHSFRDNDNFSDYGPTIILEHELADQKFYTLYGHLTKASLLTLKIGQAIKKGEIFTQIGPYPENGDWPPHLHFQLITNLLGMTGDFPGVCTVQQQAYFANICLNPNLILKSQVLA